MMSMRWRLRYWVLRYWVLRYRERSVSWLRRHRKAATAAVIATVVLAGVGIWFWGVLVSYVEPKGPTGRKDVVQVFALIVAGLVAAIGGIVGIANLQTSRRNLQQQRELEEQRAQEDALQSYFKQMGDLFTDHNLIGTDREDIRQLAQAQSLTVLARLDGPRTGALVRFLHGAGLINRHKCIVEIANAKLSGAQLFGADLHDALLSQTILVHADLRHASLRGANLSDAILVRADLYDADLSGANLSGARLFGADLSGAAVTEEQLDTCISRTHATMPNGQKYEDWLKAKNS
jgi:uncharacterized protein YjbI with pentapeptide repeats